MRSAPCKKYLTALFAALVLVSSAVAGEKGADSGFVAALISEEIRPFIMMVEGLESELDLPVVRVFMDEKENAVSRDPRFRDFSDPRITAAVAVGPRALSALTTRPPSAPVVYGMVLNPELIEGDSPPDCGVSLNLFSQGQFTVINRTFPELRKIGVLYDPANNQKWFERVSAVSVFRKFSLVPLAVSGNVDIARIFEGKGPDVDAILFVPDRTVISRTVIRHVIKKALFHRIPAIGYNRFFHESGAALSFVIDYRGVGKQVAEQVNRIAGKEGCEPALPRYRALVNSKVIRLLNARLGDPLPELVELD